MIFLVCGCSLPQIRKLLFFPFRAFLSSRDQNVISIVRRPDRDSVPIVNARVSSTNYLDVKICTLLDIFSSLFNCCYAIQ